MKSIKQKLINLAKKRIIFMDGAMGTMIQKYKLEEADFRGNIFVKEKISLKGNNDLLSLTRPEIIRQIHLDYLNAGSDIIETNTFSSTLISQLDYNFVDTESVVIQLNQASVKLAQEARDLFLKQSNLSRTANNNKIKDIFIAGSMGPTNKTASMSPKVENPAFRATSFDDLYDSYFLQAKTLIEEGVDILLAETTFDTLNLKALLIAITDVQSDLQTDLPVMVSITITDNSGRLLSGQTLEACYNSIIHFRPFSVGINCALGARDMHPYMAELSNLSSDCLTSCYPNAGLPNPLAENGYDETPEITSNILQEFAESKFVNIVGGCCGTTPLHIEAIVCKLKDLPVRKFSQMTNELQDKLLKRDDIHLTRLSGLEPLNINAKDHPFILVGERTNVMGSRKFAKLIKNSNYDEAIKVALEQVESGANILDVNFDDGLLDSKECMVNFLNLIASEPNIAKIPIMIDSSNWDVLLAGLKCIQGKGIVNSISLKDGEEEFLRRASIVKKFNAAVVVMAFDENAQAVTTQDKINVCIRAYKLLVEKINFNASDIIFDPNILTVGTGLSEHKFLAVNYINAISKIKESCPGVLISGGISNVSFSFRGQNKIREAMHSAFLYKAINSGLDMGIVNAGVLPTYDQIDKELLLKVENVLWGITDDATEELIQYALTLEKLEPDKTKTKTVETQSWRNKALQERVNYSLINGVDDYIINDMQEAVVEIGKALNVIENVLMCGMNIVGKMFGEGKLFLPQVIKSARVMKKAVAFLEPLIELDKEKEKEQEKANNIITKTQNDIAIDNHNKTIVLATVKGDVHDIGKNIVSVIMSCNGYKVIDLGVMTDCQTIMKAAISNEADFIGLSGLITPSLEEMIFNVKEFQKHNFKIPILIGGATTSFTHTSVKIQEHYDAGVIQVQDASLVVDVCKKISSENGSQYLKELKEKQNKRKKTFLENTKPLLKIEEANSLRFISKESIILDIEHYDIFDIEMDLKSVVDFIDWTPLFWAWGMKGSYPKILDSSKYKVESNKLLKEAKLNLDELMLNSDIKIKARYGLFKTFPKDMSRPNEISIKTNKGNKTLYFIRSQKANSNNVCLALSDFIGDNCGSIGLFCVTMGDVIDQLSCVFKKNGDDYKSIMFKVLSDRLVEAAAEKLHLEVRKKVGIEQYNYTYEELIKEKYRGIRPAPGYPSCPDHHEKLSIWNILDIREKLNVRLTENYSMSPPSSICGYYFFNKDAKYFNVGKVGEDQIDALSKSKEVDISLMKKAISSF